MSEAVPIVKADAQHEVKDADLIFDAVFGGLAKDFGLENLHFPREVIWLNGAPGAGKGTQTHFLMQTRGLTAGPIVVSSLLKSPAASQLIDAGQMVGDREVTDLVFRALLAPENHSGIVVDGFPRTKVQVLTLKLLYERLNQLRNKFLGTVHAPAFTKPLFHIVVLFIDEGESVRRQLYRGQEAVKQSATDKAAGLTADSTPRATDLSPETAANRYRTFKEITYESLRSLREIFHYHYVNALGSIDDVRKRIEEELSYQSSLELDQATHDRIAAIPIAQSLGIHARQELVDRLARYNEEYADLFLPVIELIQTEFIPTIRTHAISGKAYVYSESPIFEDPIAIAMVIDIFSERGYHTVADHRRYPVPVRVNPETFEIETRKNRLWRFIITFPGSEIRRGV
jgi:adenylate kinase